MFGLFRLSTLSTYCFCKFKCGSIETKSHTKYEFGRKFHTTPRRFINPFIILIIKPVVRAASIISGKILRKWWKEITPERKNYYKKKYFLNIRLWTIPLGLLIAGGGVFYMTHLQSTPITNRKRFILFSERHMTELNDMKLKIELKALEGKILPPKSVIHIEVWGVVDRLINSNEDIEKVRKQEWTLHVIDENIENAFALNNGHIFVYTGLLKRMTNRDQLAFVLGHEMAHVILNHTAEKISFTGVLNVIMAVMLLFIWAVLPDSLAILVQAIQNKISNVVLDLPYHRNLELEADKVGLKLASKACFNVKESSIFLKNWELDSEDTKPEFLRTHPLHTNRAKELDKLMPEALEILKCNCPDFNRPSKR